MQRTNTKLLTCAAIAAVLSTACSAADHSATQTSPHPASASENGEPVAPATTKNDGGDDDSVPLPIVNWPTSTAAADAADAAGTSAASQTVTATFEPVELSPVDGPAPVQPPPTPSAPADLAANPVVIGDLTSNAPGCASNCVTSAVLDPGAIGTPASIRVDTKVATRMTLWMSTKSIVDGPDGAPTFAGSPAPVATSGAFRRNWTAPITDLSPDRTYRAILRVVDRFGNERFLTGVIHTPHSPAADDLVATGGCLYQCITMGVVQPTTDYDRVNLVVATEVTARLAVYVSRSAPGTVGGAPLLPESALVATTDLGTTWSIPLDGLAGDTTYHVIVKAQDTEGHTAHRVGQFRSMPEPPTDVMVAIEQINLLYDGDPGANRGEVLFMWGAFAEIDNSTLNPSRVSDGFQVEPGDRWTISVAPGEVLPRFGATVWEQDSAADNEPSCWYVHSLSTVDGQRFIELCDMRANGVYSQDVTVDYLAGVTRCSVYGIVDGADDACLLLTTNGGTEDYAQIEVLVRFQIL